MFSLFIMPKRKTFGHFLKTNFFWSKRRTYGKPSIYFTRKQLIVEMMNNKMMLYIVTLVLLYLHSKHSNVLQLTVN